MTLLGRNTSVLGRVFDAVRTVLFPRPRPRVTPRRALVLAHRGTDGRVPENTVKGCRLAVEGGADGFEVDLCMTRDGKIVLWHDCHPDALVAVVRQAGAEGRLFVPRVPEFGSELRKPVSQLLLSELLASHGYEAVDEVPPDLVDFDPEVDCRPALLDDLLDWAATERRARVLAFDVKLKPSERARLPSMVDTIAAALAARPVLADRRIFLLTVHREVYETMTAAVNGRSNLRSLVVVPDFELPGVMDFVARRPVRYVSLGINPRRAWASTRDDLVQVVHAREQGELDGVLVWTANGDKVLAELGKLAVDAVITDDVAAARRILDAEHERHVRLLERRERARIRIPDEKVR